MELDSIPDSKGTYVLVSQLESTTRLEIGRMGELEWAPGFYLYVGSAFGGSGLRARIEHHLGGTDKPHWHIDYLLQVARPLEVWWTPFERKVEQDWAELIRASRQFQAPVPRFGASDYRRSRAIRLFYSKRQPTFGWFKSAVADAYMPSLPLDRLSVA